MVAAIDRLPPRRTARTRLAEEALEVAAHGIFVPAANAAADAALAAWASRRGIPPQVVLPDTPRVVFRATALSGADDNVGRRRLLERCTLVHEYFHAVVETGLDARTLQAELLENSGVATIAGTSFGKYGEGYLRFSYANSHEAISEAIERIRTILGNLPVN